MSFWKKKIYNNGKRYKTAVKCLYVDISELIANTGWKPEVAFKEGIMRIIKGVTHEV
jgi:nucleoside-diphosphate-sugar epimerase